MTRATTVVLVEDDDDLRESTAVLLRRHGYVIHAAASGAEALGLVGSVGAVDAFLVDLKMPGMNGLELRERLRADPAHAHTPILLMTATRFAGEIPEGEVVLKPMTFERLLSAIETVCESRAVRATQR